MKFQRSHSMVYKNIALYRSFKKSMLKWEIDYVYEVKVGWKWILIPDGMEILIANWPGGVHSCSDHISARYLFLKLHLKRFLKSTKNEPLNITLKSGTKNINFKKSYLI